MNKMKNACKIYFGNAKERCKDDIKKDLIGREA
jgi:hypothetical protein